MSLSIVTQNEKLGIFIALACSVIYGLYPAATQAAYADGTNAAFVVLCTTLFRTLVLVAYCWVKGEKLFQKKEHTIASAKAGFWQSVSILTIVTSLLYIPGPVMIIIIFTATLMLLFFMAWRGEVKLNRINLTSTVMALIGLSLVIDVWHAQPIESWVGIALAFIAAIATTSRYYVYGHLVKHRPPAPVGAESFLIACIFVILFAFWKVPVLPQTAQGFGWVILASVSLGVAGFLVFYGIALLGSFRLSLYSKIEPIFTAIFSVLLLGEVLKFHQYLGIVIVLGSLIAYQILSNRAAKAIAPVEDT